MLAPSGLQAKSITSPCTTASTTGMRPVTLSRPIVVVPLIGSFEEELVAKLISVPEMNLNPAPLSVQSVVACAGSRRLFRRIWSRLGVDTSTSGLDAVVGVAAPVNVAAPSLDARRCARDATTRASHP